MPAEIPALRVMEADACGRAHSWAMEAVACGRTKFFGYGCG